MRTKVLLAVAAIMLAITCSALAAEEEAAPSSTMGGETTPSITAPAPAPGWLERDRLTGDWGGARTWLKPRRALSTCPPTGTVAL